MDKYAVNYEDERFKNIENEKQEQLTKSENMYNDMVNNSDKYYQDQINATKDYAKEQKEAQQQQTDFTIDKINQEKEQTRKNYVKEQKGAYSDWQKQSNNYSANAENLATNGLSNSGYAQSMQVSMWNTYQNRKASAMESYNKAALNYDNGSKEAQLANNSALAQIAYNALQQELELSLQGFQYRNQLLQQKQTQLQNINDNYYNRYQNVLAQINAEIERQRAQDQWDAEFKQKQEQYEESRKQWREEFNQKERQYAIENARAERKLAAALAKEGNYTVDSTTDGDISTKILGALRAGLMGAKNATKINTNTKLSNNASTLLMVTKSLSALTKNTTKIENLISSALAQGRITKDEAATIVNKLNG